MVSSILRAASKRPLTSISAAVVTGTVGSAYAIEYRANWKEANGAPDSPKLPRIYDWDAIDAYWSERPVSVAKRLFHVVFEIGPSLINYVVDFKWKPQLDEEESVKLQILHAAKFREGLTNLGPAWVKAGQQLSTRPDLVSPAVLKELQKLCDAVRPIPDQVALELLRAELGRDDIEELFDDIRLVASASLGQVYKAHIKGTAKAVAIKVQRPGMLRSFSLDLYLLQCWGNIMDGFTSVATKQQPYHRSLFKSFAKGSYSELDYENEASNQRMFLRELAKHGCRVKVPEVYSDLTTQRVLTTEWIEGIKLADASRDTIRNLISVGVELFLTQLLVLGTFHADPHSGNLLVTEDGTLCLLDFGLCAEVGTEARDSITKAIVHLWKRDFDTLVHKDSKELGFLPEDFDTTELKPILTKVLTGGLLDSGSNLHNRKRKLMEISNELNEIFFQYPFQVPPFFALVTRGLGLLEGIALSADPDFDIFRASAPYAMRRAAELFGNEQRRKEWLRLFWWRKQKQEIDENDVKPVEELQV